jgi:hypothetical protein
VGRLKRLRRFGAEFAGPAVVVSVLLITTLVMAPGSEAMTVGTFAATPATAQGNSSPAETIALSARLKALPAGLSPPLAQVPNDTPLLMHRQSLGQFAPERLHAPS